jgi:LEA14-like dessication related protein
MPMELLAKPMARVLQYFDKHKIDSADYTMKATVVMDVPVSGNRSFDMDFTKRLPAVRLPKVKVQDVDLHALRLKKKGADIVVRVNNPNVFPLKLKDSKFSFAVEDDLKMNGSLEKIINIPPKGSQDVSMHAQVMDGSMLKAGWKWLTDKEDTRFTYNFKCKVMSEGAMLHNSTMATTMQGTLGELARAAKEIK